MHCKILEDLGKLTEVNWSANFPNDSRRVSRNLIENAYYFGHGGIIHKDCNTITLSSDGNIIDESSLIRIPKARGPIYLPCGTPPLYLTGSEILFGNFHLHWRHEESL